jgi:hypothetical protein
MAPRELTGLDAYGNDLSLTIYVSTLRMAIKAIFRPNAWQ